MMKLAAALVFAMTATVVSAQDADQGATYYADHCATCHGADARGNGPMAMVLSVAPADLTTLAAGNEGVFPTSRVIRRIDGTNEVLAHGGAMPLFGLLLGGPSGAILDQDGSELVAPEAILDITAWLETRQE